MTNIASKLIQWQKYHGRHQLPWQNTRNPYVIWLSEIMLQQTQVATVIPYYQRFLHRFPTIKNLAQATLDDVLILWSGLGYYSRARYLHQTADVIMRNHNGKFPRQLEAIKQLPGIGDSTAAAIAVFAFGQRCAILDGNVKRVFARYFGIEGYPGKTEIQKRLWQKANESLPKNSIEVYTQALMDFGTLVCTRHKPNCTTCPVQDSCIALRENVVAMLPSPKPRKPLLKKEAVFLILIKQDKILLEKRPAKGIWGGLWCPPEMMTTDNANTICAQQYGIKVKLLNTITPFDHTFTHFKLRIHPQRLQVLSTTTTRHNNEKWVSIENALTSAIPTPVRKILQQNLLETIK